MGTYHQWIAASLLWSNGPGSRLGLLPLHPPANYQWRQLRSYLDIYKDHSTNVAGEARRGPEEQSQTNVSRMRTGGQRVMTGRQICSGGLQAVAVARAKDWLLHSAAWKGEMRCCFTFTSYFAMTQLAKESLLFPSDSCELAQQNTLPPARYRAAWASRSSHVGWSWP